MEIKQLMEQVGKLVKNLQLQIEVQDRLTRKEIIRLENRIEGLERKYSIKIEEGRIDYE
jgi:hypothetical protein